MTNIGGGGVPFPMGSPSFSSVSSIFFLSFLLAFSFYNSDVDHHLEPFDAKWRADHGDAQERAVRIALDSTPPNVTGISQGSERHRLVESTVAHTKEPGFQRTDYT